MESAFLFVEKWVETPSEEQGTHLGQLKRMVAERDAAIRRECADRAVKWCGQYDGFMPGNDDTELRAAIEGKKE